MGTARTTPLNRVDNDTKEISQVHSHLYRSRSFATRRTRELISLLSSLLERLWYNYQYIYDDTHKYSTILHQFYYFVGISNNKSSDIQLLRQDYLNIPNVQLYSKLLFHRVFVIDDAVQRLKQLHDQGVVEFLVKRQHNNIKNDERPESINNNKHSKTEFDAKNKSNNMLTNSINQIFQLQCSTTCVNKYNYVQPRSDTTPLYHVSVTNPLYQGGVLLHKLYSENEELCPSPSLSSNDNKFGYISDILPTLTASQILLLFSIKGVRLLKVTRHILAAHSASSRLHLLPLARSSLFIYNTQLIASPIYKANVPFPILFNHVVIQFFCTTFLLQTLCIKGVCYCTNSTVLIRWYHMNLVWYYFSF